MTGRPVNIAEFRCRAMKARTAQFCLRDASRSSNLKVEPLILRDVSDESPVVFDIGMARDAQRFRRRANARPIAIQHRAKSRAMDEAPGPQPQNSTSDLSPKFVS